jgi:hypothetical protein
MNILKIQQDLLKAFFKEGTTVKCFNLTDGVFVTISGANGYVIPQDMLRVDLRDAQAIMDLPLVDVFKQGAPLTPTDEYRIGGTVRKYLTTEDEEVYIDTDLLKHFDNPTIYRSEHRPHLLVLVEDLYGRGSLHIVGVVVPYKIPN